MIKLTERQQSFINQTARDYDLDPEMVAKIYFDNSEFDFYCALEQIIKKRVGKLSDKYIGSKK